MGIGHNTLMEGYFTFSSTVPFKETKAIITLFNIGKATYNSNEKEVNFKLIKKNQVILFLQFIKANKIFFIKVSVQISYFMLVGYFTSYFN